MAFFMLSITLGNLFTSTVNFVIQSPGGVGTLEGADYYWFFTACMGGAAVLFVYLIQHLPERVYLHAEQTAIRSEPELHN